MQYKEDTLKHTLTIERLAPDAFRLLEERRRPVNSQSSRLKDLTSLFFDLFKKQGVALMLHQSDWKFQETLSARLGEFGVKLQVLSYHENDIVPSIVRQSESVKQLHLLRNALASFSESANYDQHEPLYGLPMKAFVMCGGHATFQTDSDDGFWTVWYCDRKNRVSACLEITHVSLLHPVQPIKRSV